MNQIARAESPLCEFHYFPLLPKELRDMVWEFAAQSQLSTPSIHFFQLQTVLDDRDEAEDGNGRTPRKCTLSVPKHSGFVDGLGFGHNPSSYLNDLAVWDACCESRHLLETGRARGRTYSDDSRVMAVRNLLAEEDLPYAKPLSGWRGTPGETCSCQCSYGTHRPTAAATATHERHNGGRRDLLVNLEQDVICLTLDLQNLTFERDGSELLDIPELRALKDDFPVRKLALQYHPGWAGGLEGIGPEQEDALRDVLDMFGTYSHLPLLECVYFIDYRITPQGGAQGPIGSGSSKPSDQAVFQGRGRSFYEVEKDDDAWCLEDTRPFLLAEELANSRSLSRAWSSEDGEEQNNDQDQEGNKTLRLIEDWAEKWGIDQNQECKFKVLACLPNCNDY
ncbi:hypothetical protein LQW54_000648 [Pestalotiopsis sp. IQ-011]